MDWRAAEETPMRESVNEKPKGTISRRRFLRILPHSRNPDATPSPKNRRYFECALHPGHFGVRFLAEKRILASSRDEGAGYFEEVEPIEWRRLPAHRRPLYRPSFHPFPHNIAEAAVPRAEELRIFLYAINSHARSLTDLELGIYPRTQGPTHSMGSRFNVGHAFRNSAEEKIPSWHEIDLLKRELEPKLQLKRKLKLKLLLSKTQKQLNWNISLYNDNIS
ncbi:unnamed protein product, partial [Nesidiocoris tenuis]